MSSGINYGFQNDTEVTVPEELKVPDFFDVPGV